MLRRPDSMYRFQLHRLLLLLSWFVYNLTGLLLEVREGTDGVTGPDVLTLVVGGKLLGVALNSSCINFLSCCNVCGGATFLINSFVVADDFTKELSVLSFKAGEDTALTLVPVVVTFPEDFSAGVSWSFGGTATNAVFNESLFTFSLSCAM